MISYKSPFGEKSLFTDDWKWKLFKLLENNQVVKFRYQNTCLTGSGSASITIVGQAKADGGYLYKIEWPLLGDFSESPIFPNQPDEQIILIEPQNILTRTQTIFIEKRNGDVWEAVSSRTFYSNLELGQLDVNRNELTNDEWKQVYEAFSAGEFLNDTNLPSLFQRQFEYLSNVIEQKLSRSFYSDVQVCVLHQFVSRNGQILYSKETKSNPDSENCDIQIHLLQDSQGNIRSNVTLNSDLYVDQVEKWSKKAQQRGLDIDIEEMRQTLLHELEEQINDKNWFQRQGQDIKAFFDELIGPHIESIQASQKVVKHIWEKDVINESLWHPKNNEHSLWPKYMQSNAYVGGTTDGIIEEVLGLPLACKSIYQLATDKEKRQALKGLFSKDGVRQIIDGIGKEIEALKKDVEKQKYAGSKTTISVVSMCLGTGVITKAGKVSDVVQEGTEKIAKNLPHEKAFAILDKLRKKHLDKNPALFKATEDFLKEVDLDFLGKVIDIPGFDKVLSDLIQHWKKHHAGKFILSNIKERGDIFINKIEGFEVKFTTGRNFQADVRLKTGEVLEYKSWSFESFSFLLNGPDNMKQFKNYLKNGKFEYIFDRKKIARKESELNKLGLTIDDFVYKEINNLFIRNADDLYSVGKEYFRKIARENNITLNSLEQFEEFIDNYKSFVENFAEKAIQIE